MNQAQQTIVDVGRGIELCYEQVGDPDNPPIVLIAGLGQQLHGSWPTDFATALAARGYRVTRFDNRDVGRSTHMDFPAPKPLSILRGGNHPRQYHLGDMARDTVGLLDVLGYQDAHLAGISMGGMIAQTVAAHYPGRVRTLTSIMSTTGAPRTGRPAMSTWWRLATAKPPRTRDEAMERDLAIFRHIGSHGFPFDEQRVRDRAAIGWDRDPTSAGTPRQLAAIFRSGDRTRELGGIDVPHLGDPRRPGSDGQCDWRRRDGPRHPRRTAGDRPRHGSRPTGGRGARVMDLITDHVASAQINETELREQR